MSEKVSIGRRAGRFTVLAGLVYGLTGQDVTIRCTRLSTSVVVYSLTPQGAGALTGVMALISLCMLSGFTLHPLKRFEREIPPISGGKNPKNAKCFFNRVRGARDLLRIILGWVARKIHAV